MGKPKGACAAEHGLRCAEVCGYGREVQSAAYNLIKDWSLEEHSYLRENVPKTGLQTPFRDGTLQNVALKVRRLCCRIGTGCALLKVSCMRQHAEEGPAEGRQHRASCPRE